MNLINFFQFPMIFHLVRDNFNTLLSQQDLKLDLLAMNIMAHRLNPSYHQYYRIFISIF